MEERGLSFKQAVNQAIRLGLQRADATEVGFTRPRKLGPARIDIAKALSLAADLEDEAISRRLSEGR